MDYQEKELTLTLNNGKKVPALKRQKRYKHQKQAGFTGKINRRDK